MKKLFIILIVILISVLTYLLISIFTGEHDKEPNSWVEDFDYEQVIIGESPTNERMNNRSANLLTPLIKKYIKTNEDYIPKWQRFNKLENSIFEREKNKKKTTIIVECIIWGCKCPKFCPKEAQSRENGASECLVLIYDKNCTKIDWHLEVSYNIFELTGHYLSKKVEYPTNAHKKDRDWYPAFYVTKWKIRKPYSKWLENGKSVKVE